MIAMFRKDDYWVSPAQEQLVSLFKESRKVTTADLAYKIFLDVVFTGYQLEISKIVQSHFMAVEYTEMFNIKTFTT